MSSPRKFDHEEAARRHQAGEAISALALEYGVTYNAVWRVASPSARERARASRRRWQSGGCADCGGQCTRGPGRRVCQRCFAKRRATSVRETELRCATCNAWKPDDAFSGGRDTSPFRRGKHQECRECQTKRRRAYRDARKQPCVGCGALVHVDSRRYPDKPFECRSCSHQRISRERRAA